MNNDLDFGSFILGLFLGFFLFGGFFIVSCDNIAIVSDMKNGWKPQYENKIYKLFIDSAATDSLHNWRKNNE